MQRMMGNLAHAAISLKRHDAIPDASLDGRVLKNATRDADADCQQAEKALG